MNLNKILFPTDFSTFSHAALQYASKLASESNAKLFIVHVDESSPIYVPGYGGYGILPDPTEEHVKQAHEKLEHVEPTCDSVEFEHRNLSGNPETEIVDFAEREQVDLIVMGSHGRTGLSRVLMGSVAESVVRRAKCPVLTVKQPMPSESKPVITNVALHYDESHSV